MTIKKQDILSLATWITTPILIGFFIGMLTKSSIPSWYAHLNKSPLTPPNYAFSIVWSVLYALIGINGWLIWNEKIATTKNMKLLYILQYILNVSWSPLFFSLHLTGAALICLIGLIAATIALIYECYNHIKIAAVLLIPYLGWLLLAVHLNWYVWKFN